MVRGDRHGVNDIIPTESGDVLKFRFGSALAMAVLGRF
jgi:hypothetical protein